MIVLDTNVVSELMRPQPDAAVLAWVAGQPRATLYATKINQAEILYGIAMPPEGKRREALAAACAAMFDEDLAASCLSATTTPRIMPIWLWRAVGLEIPQRR